MTKDTNSIVTFAQALARIVLPSIAIYARKNYSVKWTNVLDELVNLVDKGYELSDLAKRIRLFVKAVRDRANYMLNHAWEFDGLTTAGEAAEHLAVFALTKLGLISSERDPQLFIRVALTTERIKDMVSTHEESDLVREDHLLDALINAGTATIVDGQNPIPPVVNFADLLLDEGRALNRVIERARTWTRDPQWIADMAILYAYREVQEEIKPVEVPNAK
jgi:hypothetical protein